MREIEIIISDLYLGDALTSAAPGSGRPSSIVTSPALPGLEDAARFGNKNTLEHGWRTWLAHSIGRDDLAMAAPAAVAFAGLAAVGLAPSGTAAAPHVSASGAPPRHAAAPHASGSHALSSHSAAPHAATVHAPTTAGASTPAGTVWIATPIHLIAGLTSLHLDYRSLLTLRADDLAHLVQDFTATFGDSEFHLNLTPSGALLLQTQPWAAITTEPARTVAHELESSLPTGRDAPVLRRLGAEMEMWLHNHPVNEARARRGELPVSTLWLWGGAAPSLQSNNALARPEKQPPSAAASTTLALGSDPYLVGLGRLADIPLQPLPDRLPDSTQHPGAQRLILVPEITPLLHTNPSWTMFEALAHIDSRFIAPAMSALRRGAIDSVNVIANDTQRRVRRRDPLKFWRPRPKSPTAVLREFC